MLKLQEGAKEHSALDIYNIHPSKMISHVFSKGAVK